MQRRNAGVGGAVRLADVALRSLRTYASHKDLDSLSGWTVRIFLPDADYQEKISIGIVGTFARTRTNPLLGMLCLIWP